MSKYYCHTCGVYVERIMTHHILPRSLGGTDLLSNVINICELCHSKIHSHNYINQGVLIQRSIDKMKAQGIRLGPPIKINDEMIDKIKIEREKGYSMHLVAKNLGISVGVVHKVLSKPIDHSEMK